MKNKLLTYMNWPIIESIVYSEEDNPHTVLGKTVCSAGSIFQTFQPHANKVFIKYTNDKNPQEMIKVEEEGYFAALIKEKKINDYTFLIENEDGIKYESISPYDFPPLLKQSEIKKIEDGDLLDIYNVLGAHEQVVNGIKGVRFAVWAPNALRMSVVGSFNQWDGRIHQMRRIYNSSLFELFIPNVKSGENYKYEVKLKNSLTYLKNDPYAKKINIQNDNACIIVPTDDGFKWTDKAWINKREKEIKTNKPFNIMEINFELFYKQLDSYSLKEKTEELICFVKKMNYTHIQCNILMDYNKVNDEKIISNFYALNPEYALDEELKYFINQCHKDEIGVIFDWNIVGFSKDLHSLMGFDGTSLYEHANNLQGDNYKHDMKVFNYARNEVANFILSNALYWIEKFHIDGLCLKRVGEMLYLDYGKEFGDWIPNLYGGNENIEAIDFLKNLNLILKKKNKGILTIADDSTKFPNVTGSVKEDGLGFDYKWNLNWTTDMLGFFAKDPKFRKNVYNEFTFSMLYAYSEKFILSFSEQEMLHARQTFLKRMYGDKNDKLANLRAMYTYMILHPGKKMTFLDYDPFLRKPWKILQDQYSFEADEIEQISNFIQSLHELYKSENSLWLYDYDPKGFEWINAVAVDDCLYTFSRSGKKIEDKLFVVCNFSNKAMVKKAVGVPFVGKFKEIFNSDSVKFGGSTNKVARKKTSKEKKIDGMKYSINVDLEPLSVAVFKYEKNDQKKKK